MGLVDGRHDGIDLEAVGDLGVDLGGVEDDAHSQDVVDLVEGDALGLHLGPHREGSLDACLDVVVEAELVETLSDGSGEVLEGIVEMASHGIETLTDGVILLGVLVAETEILELLLDLVEAEAVCEGGVDVERLASYLVLLVGELRPEGAHVVETVGDFDEDNAYVVAHGEEQFLETLGLSRGLVAEDTS